MFDQAGVHLLLSFWKSELMDSRVYFSVHSFFAGSILVEGYSPRFSSAFRRAGLGRVGGLHPLKNAQPPYKLLQAHLLSFHRIFRYLFTGPVGGHEGKEHTEEEHTALWFYINLANPKGTPTDDAIGSSAHSWIIGSSLNVSVVWRSDVSLQMRAFPPLLLHLLLLPDSNLPCLSRRKDHVRTDVSFSSFLFSGRSPT